MQFHIRQGGLAAVYDRGNLSVLKADKIFPIKQAIDIPLTLGGLAPFMIANALAASLAAFTQGAIIEDLCQALTTFRASVSQTPGLPLMTLIIPTGDRLFCVSNLGLDCTFETIISCKKTALGAGNLMHYFCFRD